METLSGKNATEPENMETENADVREQENAGADQDLAEQIPQELTDNVPETNAPRLYDNVPDSLTEAADTVEEQAPPIVLGTVEHTTQQEDEAGKVLHLELEESKPELREDAALSPFATPEIAMPGPVVEKPKPETDIPESPAEAQMPTAEAPNAATEALKPKTAAPKAPKPEKEAKPLKPKKPARIKPCSLTEAGPAEKTFQLFSRIGLLILIGLVLLLTFQEMLFPRDFWFSDEVRHADIYMNMLQGDWLALTLNGLPYPDKPPLYFWFLNALDMLPGLNMPQLFFVGIALSTMLFVALTWLFARALGFDKRVAFASGLLLLSTFYFIGLTHYPRMDMLFSSVILAAFLCFYKGWVKQSAPVWLTFAFLLTGLACLMKGPFGLALPLVASIFFLLLRGTPGRLNGKDGVMGFALMLLMLMAWICALYFTGNGEYLATIFQGQIWGRAVEASQHPQAWWYYLVALPLVLLPWVFLIFYVNPWQALKGIPAAFKARKEAGTASGALWLWVLIITGFVALTFVSSKIAVYLLPLMAPLAILLAKALLNLSPRRSRYFFFLVGVLFVSIGILFCLCAFADSIIPFLAPHALPFAASMLGITGEISVPPVVMAWATQLFGFIYLGIPLIILGLILVMGTRRSLAGGSLLVACVGIILCTQGFTRLVAPDIAHILSPRAQAVALQQLTEAGYAPVSYKVYSGTYTYYAGQDVPAINNMEQLQVFLTEHDKVVLAMREKDWKTFPKEEYPLTEVHRQWIIDQPYVLFTQEHASVKEPITVPATTPVIQPAIEPFIEPDTLPAPVSIGADTENSPENSTDSGQKSDTGTQVMITPQVMTTPVETPAEAPTTVPTDGQTNTPAETPADVPIEPAPPSAPKPTPDFAPLHKPEPTPLPLPEPAPDPAPGVASV